VSRFLWTTVYNNYSRTLWRPAVRSGDAALPKSLWDLLLSLRLHWDSTGRSSPLGGSWSSLLRSAHLSSAAVAHCVTRPSSPRRRRSISVAQPRSLHPPILVLVVQETRHQLIYNLLILAPYRNKMAELKTRIAFRRGRCWTHGGSRVSS